MLATYSRRSPTAFQRKTRLNYGSDCRDFYERVGTRRYTRWCDRRESFHKNASRPCSTALSLPDAIEDGVLLNRLKAGLPTRLQDQSRLVTGGFDKFVSRFSCLSTPHMNKGVPLAALHLELHCCHPTPSRLCAR